MTSKLDAATKDHAHAVSRPTVDYPPPPTPKFCLDFLLRFERATTYHKHFHYLVSLRIW